MSEVKEVVKTDEKLSWDEALNHESWIAPLVNIYETENDYTMLVDMPGVNKENLKIKLEDNSLTLMGRIDFNDAVNRKYVLRETKIGNYYRKFKISDSIDQSKIDAELKNGQLVVTMPKHERVKPKTIDIK